MPSRATNSSRLTTLPRFAIRKMAPSSDPAPISQPATVVGQVMGMSDERETGATDWADGLPRRPAGGGGGWRLEPMPSAAPRLHAPARPRAELRRVGQGRFFCRRRFGRGRIVIGGPGRRRGQLRIGSGLLLVLQRQGRAARRAEAGVGLDLGAAARTEAIGHARASAPAEAGEGADDHDQRREGEDDPRRAESGQHAQQVAGVAAQHLHHHEQDQQPERPDQRRRPGR